MAKVLKLAENALKGMRVESLKLTTLGVNPTEKYLFKRSFY